MYLINVFDEPIPTIEKWNWIDGVYLEADKDAIRKALDECLELNGDWDLPGSLKHPNSSLHKW